MHVYYQVKHTLQAPTLARKFHISNWFPYGEEGQAYSHVITMKTSQMGRLPNFLRYGAPLRHDTSTVIILTKFCLQLVLTHH